MASLARGGAERDDSDVVLAARQGPGMKGDVTMARVDMRLQAWGWLTRRIAPIATMSDAEIIALQGRKLPGNPVTNWLFGTVAPQVKTTDTSVPGPAGELTVRVYQPAVVPIRRLFHQPFFKQPVDDTAGIAHFVQHPLADLERGQGLAFAAQDAEYIELSGGDVPFFKDRIDLLGKPVKSVDDIDPRFLILGAEFPLVYFIFKCHTFIKVQNYLLQEFTEALNKTK